MATSTKLMKFIFCLGLVWSMDGQKPIHHFPTLVGTEAVSTFVEKMMSYWTKGSTKKDQQIYGAKLNFLIISNLFRSNHFLIRPNIKLNYHLTMKKDTAWPFSLIRGRMPFWNHFFQNNEKPLYGAKFIWFMQYKIYDDVKVS